MADTPKQNESISHPIVIDMGSVRKKRIQQLKKGGGKLADEVAEAVAQVQASLGDDANKQIVPVVIVYRQKRKKSKMRVRSGLGLPFTY
jgi:hypothetical protein